MLAATALAAAAPLPAPRSFPEPTPAPTSLPGQDYALEPGPAPAGGAPVIYSYLPEAGPGETVYLHGSALAADGKARLVLLGQGIGTSGSGYDAEVKSAAPDGLLATIPEGIPDGLFLAWPVRGDVTGLPVRINAPELWWLSPAAAQSGHEVWLFGRNLARRPGLRLAYVWATGASGGRWIQVIETGAYRVKVRLPDNMPPGDYRLWVYAGMGGRFGWSEPVPLTVLAPVKEPILVDASKFNLPTDPSADAVPAITAALKAAGPGKVVMLPAGTFTLMKPLVLTGGQHLRGQGSSNTILQLAPAIKLDAFPQPPPRHRGTLVGSIHTPGDTLRWRVTVPAAGDWSLWVYYGADNSPWGVADMGGHTQIQADNSAPVSLDNLPNTGSFGDFKWCRTAKLNLTAGEHTLTWTNVKGGGLNLDRFALALDPAWKPDAPRVTPADRVVVFEAEDYIEGRARDWASPERAVVLINGTDIALQDVTILGAPACSSGVFVRDSRDVVVSGLIVSDIPTAPGNASALQVSSSHNIRVFDSSLRGRAPVLIEDVSHLWVRGCTLRPDHGNANGSLAAFIGTGPIMNCVLEGNRVTSTRGTPETMRLLWWNTGGGCVAENWIAQNDGANFGGQPGQDSNVGEAILFESNLSQPWYGPAAAAADDWLELPAQGPDWSMLAGVTLGRYAVVVVNGPGAGQARLIRGLDAHRLLVDRPWAVAPTAASTVLITEEFYRNHVIGNLVREAMTGCQFWVNGHENIIAGNRFEHMRRDGILLFAMVNKLAPVQTPGWNGGIGTIFYNLVVGNHLEEVGYGPRINLGGATVAGRPIPFPLALGNAVRRNTVVHARSIGMGADLRGADEPMPPGAKPILLGSIFEWNRTEDCPTAAFVSRWAAQTIVRRSHLYFWNTPHDASIGVAASKGTQGLVVEGNHYEGPWGDEDAWIKHQVEQ
jgi:hypothetical protein